MKAITAFYEPRERGGTIEILSHKLGRTGGRLQNYKITSMWRQTWEMWETCGVCVVPLLLFSPEVPWSQIRKTLQTPEGIVLAVLEFLQCVLTKVCFFSLESMFSSWQAAGLLLFIYFVLLAVESVSFLFKKKIYIRAHNLFIRGLERSHVISVAKTCYAPTGPGHFVNTLLTPSISTKED